MKTPQRVDTALKRLSAALDQLEAAQSRREKADLMRSDLAEELVIMQDDRSRLAVELDLALARAKSLEMANREAAERLAAASAVIRAVLATVRPSDEDQQDDEGDDDADHANHAHAVKDEAEALKDGG
jgi:hypothetical protein